MTRSDAGEREPMKEVYEGKCTQTIEQHVLVARADIAFILIHRYIGKRVRITIEEIAE